MVRSVRDLPTGVREGEVLAGKYRIGKVLGAGAMGTVVAAHHLLLDQKVAIKFLVPEALGHPQAVARFMREARATVRLRSEHVVRVLDVAVLEGGAPYIVMEYLEGCDLAGWLGQRGALPIGQAVDFILQACDAIAEAHELGVIHRDVKPANLFAVQRAGVAVSIKVLDFGISKTEGVVPTTLTPSEFKAAEVKTEERTMIGSPFYMSPEQMESARDVDSRTDIWALGVTLCELVTGKLPYEGKSIVQVYSRIASQAPLRLRDSSPHLPAGLEAIILKCLSKNPEGRYRSVKELATALAEFGSGRAAKAVDRAARQAGGLDPRGSAESLSVASPSPRTLASQITEKTLPSTAPGVAPKAGRYVVEIAITLGSIGVIGAVVALKVVARGHVVDGPAPVSSVSSESSAASSTAALATAASSGAPSSAAASSAAASSAPASSATPSSTASSSSEPSSTPSPASAMPHAPRPPSPKATAPESRPHEADGASQSSPEDARPPTASSAPQWLPPDTPR
jgi:eukaryotic-like serine/threonine-protein kinase